MKNIHKYRNFFLGMLCGLVIAIFCMARFPEFVRDLMTSVLPTKLVELTNEQRADAKVALLKKSALLTKAAQLKANDMVKKGYFEHTSPEGKTPWYWLEQVGYEFTAAGENLAVDFDESGTVSEAWMNSPSHRENLLDPEFTEIGIATAQGVHDGKKTIFVVQLFAKPAATMHLRGSANVGQALTKMSSSMTVKKSTPQSAHKPAAQKPRLKMYKKVLKHVLRIRAAEGQGTTK